MKRKIYTISCNGKPKATKHAWNTAKRHIPSVVKTMLCDKESAVLIEQENWKDEHGLNFTKGIERWKTTTGDILEIMIERAA